MASELRVNTLKDAAGNNSIATSFVAGGSAKAWASINGSGTIAYRDSFNSSSLTDNGSGDHSVGFSSSFNAASNYSLTGNTADTSSATTSTIVQPYTVATLLTGSARLNIKYGTADAVGYTDMPYESVTIHGDLA
tara:strand:+ start:260 stop:664 length:405 start_codon:yes stop_codon:yes gene_type:complete